MTPEERAAELTVEMIGDRAIQLGCDDYVMRQVTAAIAAEREECAMHVFTRPLAEFAGDTIPAQITHRTGLANSIRYRDRKDGAE